jgi:hypothetical protein
MVNRVGLTEAAAERRVGTYSLGMRQRLGIAVALIDTLRADPRRTGQRFGSGLHPMDARPPARIR